MRILFGYRYGIVGGVCTQLSARLGAWTDPRCTFAFGELQGGEALLCERGTVVRSTPDDFRARARDADAVVVIDTPEYLDAVEGAERPVLLEVHTTTERGLAYLERRGWCGHRIAVPSLASAELLRERFGLPDAEVVGNVVDAERFRPLPARGELPDRPILAWVGKLDDHKNWQAFLELSALLVHGGLDLEIFVVGGYTAPAPIRRALVETATALDVAGHLRWLPRIDHGAMPRFLAAVRATGGLVVSTTRNESFGMSIAEALACGVPVVAPRVGALPELAPDDAPYLSLYPPGDPSAAAEAVRALAPGRPERAEADVLLELDRPRLVEAWSPEAVARRYGALLRSMVREDARPR